MRQSRSSVLPKTASDGTRNQRSLLGSRLMAVAGVLGLVASFWLMAASAPAHARVQRPPAATREASEQAKTVIAWTWPVLQARLADFPGVVAGQQRGQVTLTRGPRRRDLAGHQVVVG
jgi:hypothetical protein